MKKYIKIGCIVLLFIGIEQAKGQIYSLDQCRELALDRNIKMRTAAVDVEMAEQDKKEAFTNYFPSVSASGFGFNANKGLVENAEISMLKNGISANLMATQPIFAGRQIAMGNQLANVGVDISRLLQRQSQNEVRLTVEQYYWQVMTLKEKLKTLTTIESMLKQTADDVETAVEAGVVCRNDLLQVQLRQNDVMTNRINMENALRLSLQLLAQYTGVEEADFDVSGSVSPDFLPDIPSSQYTNHREALCATVEYQLLTKQVDVSVLQKKMTVGGNMPSVAVGAGCMYDDLMDKSHSFGMVYATVNVPLSGWWGGSHAIHKQNLQIDKSEMERDDNSKLLVIRMQQAWNDWEDAYKETLVAHKSIEQSMENLRLNEDYYKAGTTKMSDLLDAQSLFQQSCDKYVESFACYQLKKLEYMIYTGH